MKKLLGLSTLIALFMASLVLGAAPAKAAGEANDATLSAIGLGGWTRYNGVFDGNRTDYEVFTHERSFQWDFVPSNSGASVRLTEPDGTIHDFTGAGSQIVDYAPKIDQLTTIRVTSADSSKSVTYRFHVSSKVMIQPEMVNVSQTTVPNNGSTYVTFKIRHFFGNTPYCSTNAQYNYLDRDGNPVNSGAWWNDVTYQADGTAIVTYYISATDYNFRYTGKADFVFTNYCNGIDSDTGGWTDSTATATYANLITFANPTVTWNNIPNRMTFSDVFDVKGYGITGEGHMNVYMQDPVTTEKIWIWSSWRMTDAWARYRLGGSWDASQWGTSKPVDIIVEQYDYSGQFEPVVLLKKRVTYDPYQARNVAVSPAKGPIAGGNTIKVQGVNLCAYYQESWPTFYIGGQAASIASLNCSWGGSSDGYHWDQPDRGTIVVPAGTQAGPVTVEVDNGYGRVALPTKYIYGDKPTLTAVSPSTVANTGGSVVTLTGTNFGTSGTPTVTVDGIKSPWVQRVSATKILAMIPALAGKTGAVDLNIISASGGGALDAPGTITLANSSATPTISTITPNTAGLSGGDTIVIKGTGFAAGATGVYIGDYPAAIISSTATEVQVELPTGDAAGAVNVVVGTPTGLATKTNGFTYKATPGITSISPSIIPSASSAAAAKVVITGIGFGTTGTIKVGSAAAVAYTATAGGTTISNVAIPLTAAGQVVIVITPKGATTPFNGSVTVTGPKMTYFGPDPKWYPIGNTLVGGGYAKATANVAGGEALRIEGTGFGTSGKVKVGTTVVTPTSYTDTAITFIMPAKTAGSYDVAVVPTLGGVTVTYADAIGVSAGAVPMSITQIESSVDNTRGAANYTFDPTVDASDLFVIRGTKLNGTDPTKTRVYVAGTDTAIVPVSVTATSVTFHAPRGLSPRAWYSVRVVTNVAETHQNMGILYEGVVPPPTVMTPSHGLCLKTSLAGRNPVTLTATGAGVFGSSGSVTIDGVAFPAGAVTWTADRVDVDFANLTTDLTTPWGAKTVIFTPADSSKVPQSFGFTCAVDASVSTTLSGQSSSLTINAGTAYTAAAAFTDPLPGTTFTPATDGYSWQTAEDHGIWAWNRNVHSGLPKAAGDYYVRVNAGAGTYDRVKYYSVGNSNEVHLVINGTPITFTPKLASGSGTSLTYKGQLGDGTSGSTADIAYTATNVADSVTSVSWQYRNHTCALADPNYGWTSGLPRDVAIAQANCGGNGVSVSSWDIRVAGFQMLSGGEDKSIYYLPTFNTFNLTINKKSVTATAVKAEKVYDATTSVTLGEITLTGAVDGDVVTLDPSVATGAAFADATAGNSKAITLSGPLALTSYWTGNYTLANPNLAITGKITKADARLKLTPSISSVIITSAPTITVSVATTDTRTGAAPDVTAGVPDAVVTSKTPSICTYSGGTITPVRAGDCVIEARQAASTNYTASISWHDDSTTVEAVTIKIYPAPKTLSVVADDLTIAVGDIVSPTAVATGLIEGDGLDGFTYDYYQGTTLLNAPPTAVGTYKIVPSGGTLNAADATAYSNTIKYVSGKLIITPAPPTISELSPNHGPEAGGNKVTVKGTGFGQVTSLVIGTTTLRKPKFTVNGAGTEITFTAPKGVGVVELTLKAGNASVTGEYIYDAPPPVTAPLSLKLKLDLVVGVKFSGQKVTITGGGLKANSEYTLYLHSSPVLIYKANTDSNGNFNQTVTMPGKACVSSGKHDLTLTGTAPDGSAATDTAYFVIDDKCIVAANAVKTDTKEWTLSGFLFNYNDYSLTTGGLKSLGLLVPLIKGAKTVTIYGYTETDTKSAAVKAANLVLAKNRCLTVMEYLQAKGIKAIFKTYGKGGVNPVSLTDQSKNRRVVIEANY